jgi:C1A family cysteine protease
MPTKLQTLKARVKKRGAKWRPKRTPLSDLSREEKALRLGFTPPPRTPSLARRVRAAARVRRAPRALAAAEALSLAPSSHDWRDVGGADFVTPVKEQLDCGACTAFAVCAAIESLVRIASGDPALDLDLSEAHLFYVHGRAAGSICRGGWSPDEALDACVHPGVADEACYPYLPGDQDGMTLVCSDWASRVVRITGWHLMTSPADMKSWLSTRGPMIAGMSVFDDFFDYGSGVYQHVSGGLVDGHVVCVVGYDDAAGCWICKNSFGTAWGEAGFFRIAYGQCGIDAIMWAVEGVT